MTCPPALYPQTYGNILVGVSTDRPTGTLRYAGRRFYETDTFRELLWDGTGWVIMTEPVQTYGPTLAQGASSNIAKTTNAARYHRHNGWCTLTTSLSATAAGTAGSAVTVSLPIAAASATSSAPVGSGIIYDASAGAAAIQAGQAFLLSTSLVAIQPHGSAGGGWGASPNLALASSDGVSFLAEYEMTTRYS